MIIIALVFVTVIVGILITITFITVIIISVLDLFIMRKYQLLWCNFRLLSCVSADHAPGVRLSFDPAPGLGALQRAAPLVEARG